MPKNKSKASKGFDPEKAEKIASKKAALTKIKQTEDIEEIIELSKHEDAEVRLKASQQLCPCRVQEDIEAFWDRLFEMVEDPDATVRMQVLHNICDGSPPHLEWRVKEALEKFNHDKDSDIRRRTHKVLASYLRTGEWNVL